MAPFAAGARRLLDAAERLVGVKGVQLSVREIASAARHRNSSAVAYHFGDRQGLVDAVCRIRIRITNARRAQLLAGLEEQGRLDDLAGPVEALPIVEEMTGGQPSH